MIVVVLYISRCQTVRDVIVTLVLVLVSCLGFFCSFVCCHALCWRVCGHRLRFVFFFSSFPCFCSVSGGFVAGACVCVFLVLFCLVLPPLRRHSPHPSQTSSDPVTRGAVPVTAPITNSDTAVPSPRHSSHQPSARTNLSLPSTQRPDAPQTKHSVSLLQSVSLRVPQSPNGSSNGGTTAIRNASSGPKPASPFGAAASSSSSSPSNRPLRAQTGGDSWGAVGSENRRHGQPPPPPRKGGSPSW